MSKKLMMNNKITDRAIVLCKDFSPNGQPFVLLENQMIDWDKYELYININIAQVSDWSQVIIISADNNIESYNGQKMHIYLNDIPTIRIQYGGAPGYIDTKVGSMNNVEIIFNKNGFFVNGEQSDYALNNVINGWNTVSQGNYFTIGNKNKNNLSICTYNLIQLQPYQERSE